MNPALEWPTLDQMIAMGGDDRTAIQGLSGLNRYYTGYIPRSDVLAFGSATSSTTSERGFRAASALWRRLQAQAVESGIDSAWQAQECRTREAIARQFKLDSSVHVELARSGTDAIEFGAGSLVSGQRRVAVIVVASSETGSGVHGALIRGCGKDRTRLVSIAVRDAAGNPVAETHVSDAFDRGVSNALARGEDTIVVITDLTKTGLLIPGLMIVRELQDRWGERVRVIVDACQMRTSDNVVREYLENGWPVAITGSKFWTGPSFSGALLMTGGPLRPKVPLSPNFGLLLRWEAALADASACFAHPITEISRFLRRFADVARRELDRAGFVLATASGPNRNYEPIATSWDAIQTIFPFRASSSIGSSCTQVAAAWLHSRLALPETSTPPLELGQPVRLDNDGIEAYALRFCASARLVEEALTSEDHESAVLARLRAAIFQVSVAQSEINGGMTGIV